MEFGDYTITHLKPFQVDELAMFMGNSNFLWNDVELLHYILYTLNDSIEDNIVVLYKNRIIGCNLLISNFASIRGKVRKIKWSHSTFLEPEHRKKIGLHFFFEVNKLKDIWGFGLTPINKELHKLNGTIFLSPSKGYVLNVSNYNKSLTHKYDDFPDEFTLDHMRFEKCFSAEDHQIPQNGFWNDKLIDVDFLRDRDYMTRRFYNSPINYHIYKLSENNRCDLLYFVVRVRVVKNSRYLFLVDYRFHIDKPLGFSYIIDALNYLAKRNGISQGFIFTTLPNSIIELDERLKRYGALSDIICNSCEMDLSSKLFVTPADSDCDLIPIL